MKLLTKEETIVISGKLERPMKLRNELEFGYMKKSPDINFYDDEDQFFDPNEWGIHIGRFGITNRFEAVNEKSYAKALEFVQGHESQHVHSTASVPYRWGIDRGVEVIIEYIASIENPKKRFRKPKDYEKFMDELRQKGIYVSWRQVRELVAGIANSVEDGRIEGIRASKYLGFKKLRTEYRGIFWKQGADDKLTEYSKINAAEKLRVIANQILFLSTCQLYQPGFFMTYVGTPLKDEVDALMPFIAEGIKAKTCREMAQQVIKICEKLAPLIYEAFKISAADIAAKQALEKMLSDLISAMIENGGLENSGISERDEQQGSGDLSSVFGQSDLVITLPDEVYDKLMENKEENKDDQNSGGVQVRREHPKEEEENPGGSKEDSEENSEEKQIADGGNKSTEADSEKQSSKGASGSEKQDSEEMSEDGSSENSGTSESSESDSDNKESSAKSNNASSDESEESEGKGVTLDEAENGKVDSDSSSKNNDNQEDGKSQNSSDSSEDESKENSSEDSKSDQTDETDESSDKNGKQRTEIDTSKVKDAMDAVEKAMKEAAEHNDAVIEQKIDNINSSIAHETRKDKKKKENIDSTAPISPEEMKDICSNFIELKRRYIVKENMPAVLEQRCRTMYRKNKRYFKSLSTPNVSHLDSGSIDPSLIHGLSFGDTEIFRKIGKDKKFDGCAYILIDNSGSMTEAGGAKRAEACKAAAVIEEGFKDIMPLKIVAFDENRSNVVHEVVKNWEERLKKNCCWNFYKHGRTGSGNEDGYDIMIATRELLKRPESKKMLCILSDGAPGDCGLVREAVRKARKKGIEVYAIYFEIGSIGRSANDFKYMYEKDYVCCSLPEVDENLSKLFKKFSRR